MWAENKTATFDFDTNAGTDFGVTGTSSNSSTDGDILSTVSATIDGVTMSITPKSSGSNENRFWEKSPKLRVYSGSFTISTAGYAITSIAFTTGSGKFSVTPNIGSTSGSSTSYTWSGTASSIVFSVTGNTQIKKIVVTYDDATIAITPGYAKTTYVAPDKLDFSAVTPAGLIAYVATAAGGSGVTMTSVDAVPANTPLVLIGTANTTYRVPVAASASAPATNKLVKGDGTTVFDGTTYDYALGSDGKFHLLNSGTMATTKAYLHLDNDPGSHALDVTFEDGNTTAIAKVNSQKENVRSEYYNLNGQRVDANHKGIVVVNGKKFVNK